MCVCVCVAMDSNVCVCVCVAMNSNVCVCVCSNELQCVCVCVCVAMNSNVCMCSNEMSWAQPGLLSFPTALCCYCSQYLVCGIWLEPRKCQTYNCSSLLGSRERWREGKGRGRVKNNLIILDYKQCLIDYRSYWYEKKNCLHICLVGGG